MLNTPSFVAQNFVKVRPESEGTAPLLPLLKREL
jgi:hypothetical protein